MTGELPSPSRSPKTLLSRGKSTCCTSIDVRCSNRDVWDDLFALFGRENPESGHTKPPCCDDVFETIDDETFNHFAEEVADFLKWKHDR